MIYKKEFFCELMVTSAKEKMDNFTIEIFGFEVNSNLTNLSNLSNSKVTTSTTLRYLPVVISHI